MNLDDKKPRIFDALAGGNIQGLGTADADQHNDRIARLATLKIGQSIKNIFYGRLLHLIPIAIAKRRILSRQ